jgi:hypothetical protein
LARTTAVCNDRGKYEDKDGDKEEDEDGQAIETTTHTKKDGALRLKHRPRTRRDIALSTGEVFRIPAKSSEIGQRIAVLSRDFDESGTDEGRRLAF